MFEPDTIRIDVANDFYNDKLQLLINALDESNKVAPMVDCIGHTRNNMTQEAYKKALIEHYGNKLNVRIDEGWCSYGYVYKLEGK